MGEVDLVLAPADCSDEAESAAGYAIAVADAYSADLHVLFVLDERIARGLDVGDVEAGSIAGEHHAFVETVESMVANADASTDVSTSAAAGFSSERLTRTPGSVILDVAEELAADFIVLPRESPSGDPNETLGKAALYVLEYASQPVLSI